MERKCFEHRLDDPECAPLGWRSHVFASDEDSARRLVANAVGCDPEEVDLTPRPDYDHFAPLGMVPAEQLLADGWWISCWYCGHWVEAEGCDYCHERAGPDSLVPPVVVSGEFVYCSESCHQAEQEERRQRKIYQGQVLEEARRLWPLPGGAAFSVACEGNDFNLEIDFPGRKGMCARWKVGAPTVTISACDKQAWQEWSRLSRDYPKPDVVVEFEK